MKLYFMLMMVLAVIGSHAQQTATFRLLSNQDKKRLQGSIRLQQTGKGYISDTTGLVTITFQKNGFYTIVVSSIGFEEIEKKINIPLALDTVDIEMELLAASMEEVIIQSTRTSRSIANTATRVEAIDLEEIDEKNNMRPGNVAMLLHESTGIQVQQTSATSANASIRIQGLDGRYTQLLKDGFANFGNFSSGLSILEIPPLDLKQVEIIKGPASTLFGGGAIAGVINFISKTPKEVPEYSFILNQSSAGQTNIGGFSSARKNKVGYTLLALYNRSSPYDVDKDEFTEIPKSKEYSIHPSIFFYPNETSTITIGNSFTQAERTGGDVQVIKSGADASHQYAEQNKTLRNTSTVEFQKKLPGGNRFTAKQSFSLFNRSIRLPFYRFSGTSYNLYTDVSFLATAGKHAFVVGGNFIHDDFREKANSSGNRNNTSATAGLYVQHTLDVSAAVKLESGLRVDRAGYTNTLFKKTELFMLPRVSMLVKYSTAWSSRIGAGLGYKTPTLFTEETETIQYRAVKQFSNVRSERSYGATADVNFRTNITDHLAFSFNHMFFYTVINHPLVLTGDSINGYNFYNTDQPVRTMGFETNARFIFKKNLKLFTGYTFTNSKAKYLAGRQYLPLVPKHKLNLALIYEKEGMIKLGLEGYFTGSQYLSNGMQTPSFNEFGFMAEKIFRHFSLFINFENFTDTRQSRYKDVVNGSHLNPSFDEIWTHTEGFVINGGIKIKW